ncbi:MAG: carbohydrate esterase [Clostridia bacterium]|nr:carbohydrate esterase [Clostridia bacterium]
MKAAALFPANLSNDACVDTELILTFNEKPCLNKYGLIRVFDYETDKMVDCLDLSLPAGPSEPKNNPSADYIKKPYEYKNGIATNKNTVAGTPSADYIKCDEKYQLTIIGGFSDGFHFYPTFIKGNSVYIQLHHNLLEYDRKYYVLIDSDIVQGFKGFLKKDDWTFTTKRRLPTSIKELTVSKSGKGDFRTVQGAVDFIPNHTDKSSRYTIFVKNGDYRELVYFRNKDYVTIIGESMDGVIIHYTNNEVFNPHPELIKTNEKAGTFPSRRAAFAMDNCTHIVLKNLTVKNDAHGQAEGLLVNGKNNYFKNVHIIGSGDALQTNGSAYYDSCIIDGHGDTILGRGPAYFYKTTINSINAFMWIRNTKENHGNVFVKCVFNGKGENSVIARLPNNNGMQYPDAECVLIDCELNDIPPIGFYPIDDDALSANFCEYNSHDGKGNPIDTSSRHKCVKILTLEKDAEIIEKYSSYQYVLGEEFRDFYEEVK